MAKSQSKATPRKTVTKIERSIKSPGARRAARKYPRVPAVSLDDIFANVSPATCVRLLTEVEGGPDLRALDRLDVAPYRKLLLDVERALPGWSGHWARYCEALNPFNHAPFKPYNALEAALFEREAYQWAAAYLVGLAVGRLTLTEPKGGAR